MALDPVRYRRARLVNPEHKLPWRGRLFGEGTDEPGIEIVDMLESATHGLIAGGSIELAPDAPGAEPARR